MKRGEIFIIKRRDAIGSEIMKARPGVIVSNDVLNATSTVVEVVYLTTSPRKELPTHAEVNATGLTSVAICEQIDTVSVRLVGNYVGCVSDEEMGAIDEALRCSLGLPSIQMARGEKKAIPSDTVNHPSHYTDGKIEVIDYIEDKRLGYHLGNAVKYISRAGKKDPAKRVEDLQKAIWYIKREIEREEAEA